MRSIGVTITPHIDVSRRISIGTYITESKYIKIEE
jgi:hypothetical protein